jgi:hypothetical protein
MLPDGSSFITKQFDCPVKWLCPAALTGKFGELVVGACEVDISLRIGSHAGERCMPELSACLIQLNDGGSERRRKGP